MGAWGVFLGPLCRTLVVGGYILRGDKPCGVVGAVDSGVSYHVGLALFGGYELPCDALHIIVVAGGEPVVFVDSESAGIVGLVVFVAFDSHDVEGVFHTRFLLRYGHEGPGGDIGVANHFKTFGIDGVIVAEFGVELIAAFDFGHLDVETYLADVGDVAHLIFSAPFGAVVTDPLLCVDLIEIEHCASLFRGYTAGEGGLECRCGYRAQYPHAEHEVELFHKIVLNYGIILVIKDLNASARCS